MRLLQRGGNWILSIRLCCAELTVQRNAKTILNLIQRQEAAWNITFDVSISDNAAGLAVRHAPGSLCSVVDMISTATSIVALCGRHDFSGEVNRASLLSVKPGRPTPQICLNVVEHKLIQDVSTRWNSTFDMLERLMEQREVLNEIPHRGMANTLSTNQLRLADSLILVLKATRDLRFESSSSSCILPVVLNLQCSLETFVAKNDSYRIGSFTEKSNEQLQRRFLKLVEGAPQTREACFQNIQTYDQCLFAAILYPRIKLS